MADYKFFRIPNTHNWVVLDPKRANRPHVSHQKGTFCPFCPENIEKENNMLYRIGGEGDDRNWQVIVVPNKFPFAPIHELVIHSRDHKVFKDITLDELRLSIGVYVNRYNLHAKAGNVCIFANSGHDAGESIGHAHSQIAVVPPEVVIEEPRLEEDLNCYGSCLTVGEFELMCPPYSQWPDEVWIVPKERGKIFGEIKYNEVENLAYILKRLITIFNFRHDGDFPFNYYIYSGRDWYLRFLSRAKIIGGFEVATGIYVNTQDPKETMEFIKDHFYDEKLQKTSMKAEYRRGV